MTWPSRQRRRRSSTPNSRSCTAPTRATSTATPTTGSATTTTPRTSPSRRSCRPTATSNEPCASPTAGRCALAASGSPTTSPRTTTATARARPQRPLDESSPLAAAHSTEELVSGRDELARVLEGVKQLPDDRREALIMRFALGMDNREIARALGRSDGATKVLIHRAIKQLEGVVAMAEGANDERRGDQRRAAARTGACAGRAARLDLATRSQARCRASASWRPTSSTAGSWPRCATRATGCVRRSRCSAAAPPAPGCCCWARHRARRDAPAPRESPTGAGPTDPNRSPHV